MKTSLEKISSILHCITVESPVEAVTKAYDNALKKIARETDVPGFRKGKVPADIIIKRFGEKLETEAIKVLVINTYPKALEETGARPLDEPRIEPAGKFEKGKTFTYKASFEVYPEFTAKNYENLKLECEKVSVTDDEVEAELKRLQTQMTQLEPAPEGEVGPGMIAMIDFKGTAGGTAFPGSEAENYVVDFGTGNLLEEFEIEIKGMKASEERGIKFKYPENYFKKEIAGKEGLFKVKVRDVRKKIVPELNDDFAKDLGKYAALSDVRNDLKKKIIEYKESVVKNQLREAAVRDLIEKHKDLEVPTSIIDAELGNMLEQIERQLRARGQTLADAKVDPKQFVQANIKEATDRARGYMVANAIASQEKCEITDAELNERIALIAAQNRDTPAKTKQYLEKNKLLSNLRSQMLFEKALDFVLDKAKITEKKQKQKK